MNFILIETIKNFIDNRGYFFEAYKESEFKKLGIDKKFVQDNHSFSTKGVVRGLHYQWNKPMDKLIRVSSGKIMDVIVDIRQNSPNYGQHYKFILSSENNHQLYVPAGYAHGFIVLSDSACVEYKCTEEYCREGESGINPLDEDLKINWNFDITKMILSEKDKNSKKFTDYCKDPKF